jgi:hypothetical protein
MFWMDGMLDTETQLAVLVGQSAVASNVGTPAAIGAQAGDLAVVVDYNPDSSVPPYAGWTQYQLFPGVNRLNIYSRVLSSGDLSTAITGPQSRQLIVYRYATSLTLLTSASSTGGLGYTIPGVSPSANNVGLFGVAYHGSNDGTSVIAPATWTFRGDANAASIGRAGWSDRLGLPAYAGENLTVSQSTSGSFARRAAIFEFRS